MQIDSLVDVPEEICDLNPQVAFDIILTLPEHFYKLEEMRAQYITALLHMYNDSKLIFRKRASL